MLAVGCDTIVTLPGVDSGIADTGVDAPGDAGPTLVAINFSVDDQASHTYDATSGLAWKATFAFNSVTNVVTFDSGSPGPFPMLYDDGPVATGGHEPVGATAGDHIWGVTVLFAVPTATTSFTYTAIIGSVAGSDGTSIGPAPAGTFDVPANAAGAVTVPDLVIP